MIFGFGRLILGVARLIFGFSRLIFGVWRLIFFWFSKFCFRVWQFFGFRSWIIDEPFNWGFVMSLTKGGSNMQCGQYNEWIWVLQVHEWSYYRRTKVDGDTVLRIRLFVCCIVNHQLRNIILVMSGGWLVIGGVLWWDFVDWIMLKFRYLHTTCVRQILIGFFPGHILRVGDPKEHGRIIFERWPKSGTPESPMAKTGYPLPR